MRWAKRVAIIVGIGLMAAGFSGWAVRQKLEGRYQLVLGENQQLEGQVGELRQDRERLSDALQAAEDDIAQLSEALSAKEEALQETMSRLAEEVRTISALEERLHTIQRQFAMVQGELAITFGEQAGQASPPAHGMVELQRVMVTQHGVAGLGLEGRIVSVHREWEFVVIDLGWELLKIGDVVSIYRNEDLLGRARIERTQEEVSAATLLPEWRDAEILVNDVVRVL